MPFSENLKKKILSYTQIDDTEFENEAVLYVKKEFKKNSFLLSPDQYVSDFYYLEKGCVSFYKLEDGETKVLEIYTEDVFFTDLLAYVKEVPSLYYMKALEHTVVYAVKKEDAESLFKRSHQFERFGRLSMQEAFIKSFSRIERLNSLSNEERYLRLLERRPGLFKRIPQYLIASYLGVTPVGLSKIRKRVKASHPTLA